MLKVLVVDDTAIYRRFITDILSELPELEVAGTAPNGRLALHKIKALSPDIVTLDIEMPEMNGIETLKEIVRQWPDITVIMVSSITRQGADITMDALHLGAYDFISKPEGSSLVESREDLRRQLLPKLSGIIKRREIIDIIHKKKPASHATAAPVREAAEIPPAKHKIKTDKIELLAIGISTGGPKALAQLIPKLPSSIGVPVVIVQHMPEMFTAALAETLNKKSSLAVVEAVSGQPCEEGCVYLAPGNRQTKILKESDGLIFEVNHDPPEHYCRPSVDYLFRSVSQACGQNALGVIMTGMGSDGEMGCRLMKRQGAVIFAQDEKSCVVFGMPREVIKAGSADKVVSLSDMPGEILRTIRKYNG